MSLNQFFQLIFDFISSNFIATFLIVFISGLIIWAIVNRELFIEKIKKEQISFVAMIFGVVLASANLLVDPEPLSITSLSAFGDPVIIASISIGLIAAFILVLTSIWFISSKR